MPDLAEQVGEELMARGLRVATAESCTGGMIAAILTDRAGASSVFERGFVTYSNPAKVALGVPQEILDQHGAVSAQTAAAMVEGALRNSLAQVAIAVTGIAGPTGGSEHKPVGLVYIGVGNAARVDVKEYRFDGDRASIRAQSRDAALSDLLLFLRSGPQ